MNTLHIYLSLLGIAICVGMMSCYEKKEPMSREEQCQIWNKYCDNGTCGGC
jgi:hypothetical protein